MPLTEAGNNRDKSYFDLTFQEKSKDVYESLRDIQTLHNVSFDEAAKIYELVLRRDHQLSNYMDGVFEDSNFTKLLIQLKQIDRSLENIQAEIQVK